MNVITGLFPPKDVKTLLPRPVSTLCSFGWSFSFHTHSLSCCSWAYSFFLFIPIRQYGPGGSFYSSSPVFSVHTHSTPIFILTVKSFPQSLLFVISTPSLPLLPLSLDVPSPQIVFSNALIPCCFHVIYEGASLSFYFFPRCFPPHPPLFSPFRVYVSNVLLFNPFLYRFIPSWKNHV